MIEYKLLNDLPGPTRRKLCWEFYHGPYKESFTNFDQIEDPDTWIPLLSGAKDGKPKVFIIVAIDGISVVGGIITEYYPISQCYLSTYVAVKKIYRKSGLLTEFSRLVDVIVDNKPQFAECEYPAETDWQKSRLQILHNVGWKRIEIPYIQPALNSIQNHSTI